MNRKSIRINVAELISSGVPKSEVLSRLSDSGISERKVAWFIASYASPDLRAAHDLQVKVLVVLLIAFAVTHLFLVFFKVPDASLAGVLNPAHWVFA